jgi:purine-cytosine permease-like protein
MQVEPRLSKEVHGVVSERAAGEFEREPVPESAFQTDWSFATVFAGRHTAAPELVIGPEFVLAGASAFSMFMGLIVGNILAVLSWRYVCAPIAAAKRFSTYYTVERIFGKYPLALYNVMIAMTLATIAGVMYIIAGTALCSPTGWTTPEGTDWFVSDVRVMLVIIGLGLVTTVVAMYGFSFVTTVSYWLTPPMFIVIFYMVYRSCDELGVTLGNIYDVASEKVFTEELVAGKAKRDFMACVLLAWFQDQFVHLGMVDLTLFRFAPTTKAGWMSAFGMFPGHYFLWIGACFIYAAQLQNDPKADVLPGKVAYRLAGVPGLIAIVFAGWSTANPFLYAGGLALKSTFAVFGLNQIPVRTTTAILGLVAIVPALMPFFVFSFAASLTLFGSILTPVGAIILADFYVLPRIGLISDYSYEQGADCSKTNVPAVIAWGWSSMLTLVLQVYNVVDFWYTPLVSWPVAFMMYVQLSRSMHPRAWEMMDTELSLK